jgi:hypothetical protein
MKHKDMVATVAEAGTACQALVVKVIRCGTGAMAATAAMAVMLL